VFFALLFHCDFSDGIIVSPHSPSKLPVQFSGSTIIIIVRQRDGEGGKVVQPPIAAQGICRVR
jgi:hypothetical protein